MNVRNKTNKLRILLDLIQNLSKQIPCTSCLDGFYLDTYDDTCMSCHKSCKTCDGGEYYDCFEWNDGYYKDYQKSDN